MRDLQKLEKKYGGKKFNVLGWLIEKINSLGLNLPGLGLRQKAEPETRICMQDDKK